MFLLIKCFWSFTGGIAAYNAGDSLVLSYEDVDKYTTGGDYSNDVIARAQWFKENVDFTD